MESERWNVQAFKIILKMDHKLLVIVPFYNTELYLDKCINSILQQTYTNFELVLVDDCSTDKSLEIAKSYEHLDNVTILSNNINRGVYYSINKVLDTFKNKNWDYWHFHGSDDISHPTRFEKILPLFNNFEVKCICTTAKRTNYTTGVWNIRTSEGIAFYRKEVFENIGYYDDTRFAGDTEYITRSSLFYSKFKNIPDCVDKHKEVLYFATEDTNNLTKIYNKSLRKEYWEQAENKINNFSTPEDFYKKAFA